MLIFLQVRPRQRSIFRKVLGSRGKFSPHPLSPSPPHCVQRSLSPAPLRLSSTTPLTSSDDILIGISYLPHMELGDSQEKPSPTRSQNSPSNIGLSTAGTAPGLPPTPRALQQPEVSKQVRATGNTNFLAQSSPPGNPQPPSSVQKTSDLGNLNPSANPLLYPTKPSEVQVQLTQPITLQQVLALARRNNRDLQLQPSPWNAVSSLCEKP
jgi:hypothetical protein